VEEEVGLQPAVRAGPWLRWAPPPVPHEGSTSSCPDIFSFCEGMWTARREEWAFAVHGEMSGWCERSYWGGPGIAIHRNRCCRAAKPRSLSCFGSYNPVVIKKRFTARRLKTPSWVRGGGGEGLRGTQPFSWPGSVKGNDEACWDALQRCVLPPFHFCGGAIGDHRRKSVPVVTLVLSPCPPSTRAKKSSTIPALSCSGRTSQAGDGRHEGSLDKGQAWGYALKTHRGPVEAFAPSVVC